MDGSAHRRGAWNRRPAPRVHDHSSHSPGPAAAPEPGFGGCAPRREGHEGSGFDGRSVEERGGIVCMEHERWSEERHLELEDLAALAEGRMDPEIPKEARDHLVTCRTCMSAYA